MAEIFSNGHRHIKLMKGWTYNTPEERSRHGQHAPELMLYIKGKHGAVCCQLMTGWMPKGGVSLPYWNIAWHEELSIENASESEYAISDHCEFLEGRACCGTMQYLPEMDWVTFLITGTDYIFEHLEKLYLERFKEAVNG